MLNKRSSESGFSYIDVMIAIVIMMVGILAMLSALTANLVRSLESEKRVTAKQMALSTIESIISAKEIERAGVVDGWDSVRNTMVTVPVGETNGIFLPGVHPVREEMGWDGVAGTIDDACPATGPCVVSGRPNNTSPVILGYQREIVITDIDDPERPFPTYPIARRRIDVNITYFVNDAARRESASTIVSKYEVLQ
ncbi:MAG: type IV pilus modification PilV family protein [Blastocatellia bacterium]